MHIKINNERIIIPDEQLNVKELLTSRNYPEQGTAVALNGKLVTHNNWESTYIKENDDIVIISAAFGG